MKKELIIALSIGDGFVERPNKSEKSNLVIRHSTHQKEYIEWKYNLDFEFWRYEPRLYNNCIKDKRYFGYKITSKSNHELFEIRKKLYPNDKKYISREILNYLTPLGLAIWYMDNGCIDRPVNKNSMGLLNTYCESSNAEEELIIQKYFEEVWNIKTALNKGHGRYRIRFNHTNFCKFVEIIKPYVIPSLQYKIDTTMRLNAPIKVEFISTPKI